MLIHFGCNIGVVTFPLSIVSDAAPLGEGVTLRGDDGVGNAV